jgi:hypothetical protein
LLSLAQALGIVYGMGSSLASASSGCLLTCLIALPSTGLTVLHLVHSFVLPMISCPGFALYLIPLAKEAFCSTSYHLPSLQLTLYGLLIVSGSLGPTPALSCFIWGHLSLPFSDLGLPTLPVPHFSSLWLHGLSVRPAQTQN